MNNISTNICKTGDFHDAIFYYSVCECTNDLHGRQLVVELDEDGTVSCTIYSNALHNDILYSDTPKILRIWNRIKRAVTYLFTGHFELLSEHLILKEDHLRDYANALLGAADELHRRKEQRKNMPNMSKTSGN